MVRTKGARLMDRNKMKKAPQFKRIEGIWVHRLGPSFELGLPVFTGPNSGQCRRMLSLDRMPSIRFMYLVTTIFGVWYCSLC
uniref:Uncharacterized protein n=1 Tax=Arundo donax TaxID=35708 RepID=A0A0A9F3Y8_ARUDO